MSYKFLPNKSPPLKNNEKAPKQIPLESPNTVSRDEAVASARAMQRRGQHQRAEATKARQVLEDAKKEQFDQEAWHSANAEVRSGRSFLVK